MFLSINDIYVIPGILHNPSTSVNVLFENFRLGLIDAIAADIEFCKDVSKVSVQLQTLTSLQNFSENCENLFLEECPNHLQWHADLYNSLNLNSSHYGHNDCGLTAAMAVVMVMKTMHILFKMI